MRRRYYFITKKETNKKKYLAFFFLIIGILFTFMLFSGGESISPDKRRVNLPTSKIDTEQQPILLPEENNFIGVTTFQKDGSQYLRLNFTNTEKSVINIHQSQEMLKITVTNINNASDYKDSSYLLNHLVLNKSGQTLTFTLDKRPLNRRYVISQREEYIQIKFLSKGLQGKRITIDPGHGGIDPGAVGPSGITEKEVVLPIALRLKELLEKEGAEVILTRYTDERPFPGTYRNDLIKRVEFADEFQSDMFISLHNNANDIRSVRGIETLYNPNTFNGHQSKELATYVQKHLVSELAGRDRGIVKRSNIQISGQNFVSVLPEILFITNPEDEKIIKRPDFTERVAKSLFNAIKDYYSN